MLVKNVFLQLDSVKGIVGKFFYVMLSNCIKDCNSTTVKEWVICSLSLPCFDFIPEILPSYISIIDLYFKMGWYIIRIVLFLSFKP